MGVVTIALNGIGSWRLRPAVAVQPLPSPPHAAPSEAPTKTSPQAPTTTPAAPVPGLAGGPATGKDGDVGRSVVDDQLRSIRALARRQIAAGQRQQAIDTISAGLVLDRKDPELGNLIDVMARGARQEASRARTEASRLGITEEGSPDFRDARAREQEADVMVRSGDRAAAIRAFWTASGLYERAGRRGPPATPALPAPGPASRTETEKTETPRPHPDPPAPPPAPPNAVTSERPLPAPSVKADPPPTKADPSTASGDVPRDPQSADVAAIRDTLHRYAEAYASRSSAAVGKVIPSLGAPQLRALDRDFSNLRAYGVTISNERIVVDGATATVTCQVVRSFTTTTGGAGGNTVATVFAMRKTGGVWIIEKVESR